MRKFLFRIVVVCLLSICCRPDSTFADSGLKYTTTLNANTLSELRALGASAANSPPHDLSIKGVSFSLNTKNGPKAFSLVPMQIRAKNFRAEFDDGKTKREDTGQLFAFRENGANPGEFTRLSIYRSATTGEEIIEGLSRVEGVFYQFKNKTGTSLTLDVTALSTPEVHDLVAQCGTAHAEESQSASIISRLKRSVAESNAAQGIGNEEGGGSSNAGEPPTGLSEYPTIQIATDTDYEYFAIHGNNSNLRIESIFVQIGGIYRVQLGLDVEIVYQHVNTSPNDPYSNVTNSSNFLAEYRNYWNNNFSSVQRDVAHLFTGRDMEGSVAGIAYIAVVCSGFSGYGISSDISLTYAAVLTAHEIGHNLAAGHDNCPNGGPVYVMCPVVSTSTIFSDLSKQTISQFVASSGSCIQPTSGGPTNNPPVFGSIPPKSVAEGSNISFGIPVTDPDGDGITLTSTPLEGFSLSGLNAFYAPNFNAVTGGAASQNKVVQITATDSRGASSNVSVTITVQNTNRNPVINSPGNQNVNEGTALSFTLSAGDPDNDPIRFAAVSLPYGAYLNRTTGSFRWTPRWNQSGSHPITFQVFDSAGASNSVSITITVNDTLSSPPAASLLVPTVYRPAGGLWYIGSPSPTQHGLIFDVPLAGNYYGDGVLRPLVWRPESGMWYARAANGNLDFEQFGLYGDLPSTGDVDGDGVDDLMVYRPTSGRWYVRLSSNQTTAMYVLGAVGDIPVVCDFDGDGKSDPGVFRPSTAAWYVHNTSTGLVTGATFGRPLDIPMPGRYGPQANCNLAVWEPDTGGFNVAGIGKIAHGSPGDIPTPFDTDGDGRLEYVVYKIASGTWHILRESGAVDVVQLGLDTDYPVFSAALFYALRHLGEQNPGALVAPSTVPLFDSASQTLYNLSILGSSWRALTAPVGGYILRTDRDGDGAIDLGVFSRGLWSITRATGAIETVGWGQAGDIPLGGDFDGDGKGDITVFRNGAWFSISSLLSGGVRAFSWGLSGDMPVDKLDYDGDGVHDPAVFRNGRWYILGGRGNGGSWTVDWGLPGDIPLAYDIDRDGRSDLIVYRAGAWYVRGSSGIQSFFQWGLFGDSPSITNYFGDGAALSVYRPSNRTLYTLSLNGGGFRIQTPTLRPQVIRRGRRAPPVVLQLVDRDSPVPLF